MGWREGVELNIKKKHTHTDHRFHFPPESPFLPFFIYDVRPTSFKIKRDYI